MTIETNKSRIISIITREYQECAESNCAQGFLSAAKTALDSMVLLDKGITSADIRSAKGSIPFNMSGGQDMSGLFDEATDIAIKRIGNVSII